MASKNMTNWQSINQLSYEGWGATACNYTSYIVAGVKCSKDLVSRGFPKIGNHVNVYIVLKQIF
jgi:hypothetical protein